jgi:hypothetical protein
MDSRYNNEYYVLLTTRIGEANNHWKNTVHVYETFKKSARDENLSASLRSLYLEHLKEMRHAAQCAREQYLRLHKLRHTMLQKEKKPSNSSQQRPSNPAVEEAKEEYDDDDIDICH